MKLRYLREAVLTATPAQRVVMLYDQLLQNIAIAENALAAPEPRDLKMANDNLVNAQEIVLTLQGVLRADIWDGAGSLAALYLHLHGELVAANMEQDADRLAAVAGMVGKLGEAFKIAATRVDQAASGAVAG